MKIILTALLSLVFFALPNESRANDIKYIVGFEVPSKIVEFELICRFDQEVDLGKSVLEQRTAISGSLKLTRTSKNGKETESAITLDRDQVLGLLYAVGESELFALPERRSGGFEPVDDFNLDGGIGSVARTVGGKSTVISRKLTMFGPMASFLLKFSSLATQYSGSKIASETFRDIKAYHDAELNVQGGSSTTAKDAVPAGKR